MLLDMGGGEVYADLAMLSTDRVRTGGGVEGMNEPWRVGSAEGLDMTMMMIADRQHTMMIARYRW